MKLGLELLQWSYLFVTILSVWSVQWLITVFLKHSDFLPHNRSHRLNISNIGLFTCSQAWTVALLDVLASAREYRASHYQCDSSAFHRASAGVRGRIARCDLRLCRRNSQRIAGCERDQRFFTDGRRELWNLQSAAESRCTYLYGEV